jgi:hypothetical protein
MQVHILSFEGPDAYARAGGIATRVTGLAAAGCDTHLWFIDDPGLHEHEIRGHLRLHRWCQWISRYHLAGMYDGEEGRHADYAVLHLDWLLRTSRLRERCAILWSANNTFDFDGIDWARLRQAAVITTVSRYMQQLMWGLGVDPLVLPNGLAAEAFCPLRQALWKPCKPVFGDARCLARSLAGTPISAGYWLARP